MSILNDSSSSSEDDDMIEALREAADSQFLKDSLFHCNDETGNHARDEKTELPKSLRRTIEYVEESNKFGVSQEFKNFVAKRLAKSLDESVQVIHRENVSESSRKKKTEDTSAGIKLMTNSVIKLNDIDNNDEQSSEHNKKHRKKLKTQNNSAECISKCKEAAVDPDWVLSKVSTAVWTDRPKGTVFKYKRSSDGALTEIS